MARVLVVEDDHAIREVLMLVLDAEGYDVLSATNGLQALGEVRHSRPDLILLDLMMPVMDGETFLAACRICPDCREAPIIVMSAARNLAQRAPALRSQGVRAYLAKPFDLDVLIALVESYAPLARRSEPPPLG